MVDIENWDARIEIEQSDFEKNLAKNHELAMAYIDLYSESAWYVLFEFEIARAEYEYYCMVSRKELVLIFFKGSDYQNWCIDIEF